MTPQRSMWSGGRESVPLHGSGRPQSQAVGGYRSGCVFDENKDDREIGVIGRMVKSSCRLSAYNGSQITVRGEVVLEMKAAGRLYDVRVVVIDEGAEVLRANDLEEMKLLKFFEGEKRQVSKCCVNKWITLYMWLTEALV